MRIETSGAAWNVCERSAGEIALVFLHYFAGSGRAWFDVMTRLETDYHCVAPDLRGFGDTSGLPENYTVAEAANDVLELADALRLNRYFLVGHSMGGKIALKMAALAPPGLRGLILAAPSPPTPEPMTEKARAQALAAQGDPAAAQKTMDAITAQPLRDGVRARTLEDNLRTSPAAWKWWLERGSREDIARQTANISVPLLAIAGEKDPVISPALVESAIVRRYAAPPALVIPNTGHLLPLEAAETLADLMRPFLESHRD